MKRFLCFLLFLILIFCSETAFSQELSGNWAEILKENLSHGSLLTGKHGQGEFHSFDFGSAGLVSCRGKLDGRPVLIAGLQVNIDEGWRLKKPVIPATKSPLWSQEKIYYPLRVEEKQHRTLFYTDLVFFPLIYTLTDSSQPFFVEKEISLTACFYDACDTYTANYSLSVESGKGYPTDICAALTDDLAQSTLPLPDNVSVFARISALNQIQIIVDYPQKVKSFFIQIDNDFSYTIQKNITRDNRAEIILTPDRPVTPDETLRLKLISPQGWYEADIQPKREPFILDRSSVSFFECFKSGFIFFFFSAFYLLFWSLKVKNQEELSKTIQKIYQYAFLFSLLLGTLLYCGCPLGLIFSQPVVITLQLLLVGYLLLKPTIRLAYVPFLLIGLPQIFVLDILLSFPPHKAGVFALSFWWGFCSFLPFGLTRCAPQLFQALDAAKKQVACFIRLPLLWTALWMLSILGLSFIESTPTYTESALQEALRQNKTVFVVVQNGPCLTCAANLAGGKYLYPTAGFIKNNQLLFMKANQQSEAGKALLQKHQMNLESSFYLMYSPTYPEGLRMENAYLQPRDWLKYLNESGLKIESPCFKNCSDN